MTDGVILVDKPAGPTSHDVVAWARWALRTRQIGHCGTLDPPATGLLVLCCGEATKLAAIHVDADKVYRARFVLGRATSTDDATGVTTATGPAEHEHLARARAWLAHTRGVLELPPPAVSAIHVEGRRAHARVRAGESVVLAPRTMALHDVTDVEVDAANASIAATLCVAKGTYVRSIAVAIGTAAGTAAHLGALHRVRAGGFDLREGPVVDGLGCTMELRGDRPRARIVVAGDDPREAARIRLLAALRPVAAALPAVPRLEVPPEEQIRLQHGQVRTSAQLGLADGPAGPVVVVVPGGWVLAARDDEGRIRPDRCVREHTPGAPADGVGAHTPTATRTA